MNKVLLFFAGALTGLGVGYFVGKKRAEKKAKMPDTTEEIVVNEETEDDEQIEEIDDREVGEMPGDYGYALRYEDDDEEDIEYDDDDLQRDIEEIDDYLCEQEYPREEDDVEEPSGFVKINVDEYFTERHGYDKVKLYLTEHELIDSLGDSYADIFADRGIGLDDLVSEAVTIDGNVVYYRCDKLGCDYEIMYYGGDAG